MKLNSSAELTVSCNNTVSLDIRMDKLSSQCHSREVKAALFQLRRQFQGYLKSPSPFSTKKNFWKAQVGLQQE